MTQAEPMDRGPNLFPGPITRDFLYVDLGRSRSLLAQLANGRPDQIIERSSKAMTIAARLNLFGTTLGPEATRGNEFEETRSLSDLHFTLLEESAEAFGLLTDVTADVANPDDWTAGRVAAALQEGQMIRVSCLVRLVDSSHIEETLNRMDKLLDSWLALTNPTLPSDNAPTPTKRTNKDNPQARKAIEERLATKRRMVGLPSDDAIPRLRDLLSGLFEDGISTRAMPCGDEFPECSFTGTLLPRSEYIEPERSAIFGRLGVRPTEWTLVGIVARIPTVGSSALTLPTGDFNRVNAEGMVIALLDRFEQLGMTGSAAWPSIGVIPLALYRPLVLQQDASPGSEHPQIGSRDEDTTSAMPAPSNERP